MRLLVARGRGKERGTPQPSYSVPLKTNFTSKCQKGGWWFIIYGSEVSVGWSRWFSMGILLRGGESKGMRIWLKRSTLKDSLVVTVDYDVRGSWGQIVKCISIRAGYGILAFWLTDYVDEIGGGGGNGRRQGFRGGIVCTESSGNKYNWRLLTETPYQ